MSARPATSRWAWASKRAGAVVAMKGNFGLSLLLVLCLGLLGGLGAVHAGEGVEGSAKADKLDACVAPTAFMRRNHFELIKHQRRHHRARGHPQDGPQPGRLCRLSCPQRRARACMFRSIRPESFVPVVISSPVPRWTVSPVTQPSPRGTENESANRPADQQAPPGVSGRSGGCRRDRRSTWCVPAVCGQCRAACQPR